MPFDHSESSPRAVWNVPIDAVHSPVEIEFGGGRFLFASTTDPLGMSTDPRVREAAVGASKRLGLAALESLSVTRAFEEQLQAIFGVRQVRLTTTGALPSLLFGANVRADADLHFQFGHPPQLGFDPLDASLSQPSGSTRRVTASAVRLMSGDLLPIPRMVEICDRAQVPFVAVDPVGFGVLGPKGRGALEHLGGDAVHVSVVSLASVLGADLWAVVNADQLEELPTARVPAALIATARKATELALEESSRRNRIFDIHERLLNALRTLGFDTGQSVTPWLRVWMGDEDTLETWCAALKDASIAVNGLLWGTSSRLHISVAATAPDAALDQLIDTFERLARKLGIPTGATPALRDAIGISRPGSFITTTPAGEHWRLQHAQRVQAAPMQGDSAERPLRERVSDMVETFAWRATRIRSTNIPGTETLRTLLDRARPSKKK